MASSYPSRLWAQLAKCVYIITCGRSSLHNSCHEVCNVCCAALARNSGQRNTNVITQFEFIGFCGTPSSALEDAALAEPLLRNAQQHPAASSEAPSSSVLPASQQQPALPAVSKASPKSATAAVRGPESNFSNNDVSGAHADPITAKQAQSPGYASDDPSNLTVPDQQKSRNSPRSSVAGTPDSALTSEQVLPFPKLKSPQPAQAHGPKDQAPSGPIPREPANSEFSHGEHAPLAAADKLPAVQPSKGSAAKPPVIEQNSKASTDRAEAAADKTSSAASSGTAAAASSDSESCSQSEATTVSQTETASQELHGNSGAAALKTPLSDSAAKGVQSEAQVKPSGQDVAVSGDAAAKQSPIRPSAEKASTADKSSAAKGDSAKKSEVKSAATGEGSASTDTAAQQSPVKPTAEGASVAGKQSAAKGTVAKQNPDGPAAKEYLAAKESPAATGAAAKRSKGEIPSAAESGQAAVSSSSQPVLQSTSKVKHSQQSIADHAAALAANESQSATAAPTGTASKPQRRVQGSTGNIESAEGKLEEEEIHRKTQPNKADEDRVDGEKPQSNSTQGRSPGGHPSCSSIFFEAVYLDTSGCTATAATAGFLGQESKSLMLSICLVRDGGTMHSGAAHGPLHCLLLCRGDV